MAEHINKTDTLNEGRVKLNAAISDSNIAKDKSEQADVKSTQALANSESTQTQLDTIVIEGDSSVEAAQARVDELGEGHATLKARIDDGFEKTSSQLAQIAINVKNFGAVGDGITDDTIAIQNAIDSLQAGQELFFPKGVYLVSKNISLPNYPNNDQPCLVVYFKNNINLTGDGAKLKVNEHAQGILEIRKSNDIIVKGLIFEGCGKFPALDGNTGRGEKGVKIGTQDQGYNTPFWGTKRNNSYDTSTMIGSGYNGIHPTTGTIAWGTFEGGYIGNIGSGLLVYDGSKRITITDSEAFGFNYCGFYVGAFDEEKAYSEDVLIERCYSHDNYDGNYNFHNSLRGSLIHSKSKNAGHPDSNASSDLEVNPGYGVVLRQSANYAFDTTIRDNSFINDRRKPIDSHSGVGIFVLNNRIYGGGWAGAIALYRSYTNARADRIVITGNQIKDINVYSGFGSGILVEGLSGENTISTIISDNIITNSKFEAYHIYVYNLKNAQITGNIIKDDIVTSRERCYPITVDNVEHFIVNSNYVDIAHLINSVTITPACVNVNGKTIGIITNNTLINGGRLINVVGSDQNINVINNSLLMKNPSISPTAQPISGTVKGIVSQNYYGGGIATPDEIRNQLKIKMRVTFNGTVTPNVNVLEGQEYIDGSVDLSTREMIIRFKNNNLSRIPNTNVIFQEALGLTYTDGATNGRCYQYYAIPSSGITTIGFRPSGSTYTDVKNITSGTVFITIEY